MLRQFPLYTDDYTEYTGSIYINLFINMLKMNEFLGIIGSYEYIDGTPSWTEEDKKFVKLKCEMIKKRYDQMYNFLKDGQHISSIEFVTEWLHGIENYIDFLLFYDRVYYNNPKPICFESNGDNSLRWITIDDFKVEIEMTVIENPVANSIIISSKKEKYITFYRIYYKNKIILDLIDDDTIDSEDNVLEFEDTLIITECLNRVSIGINVEILDIIDSIYNTNNMLRMDEYIEEIDKEEIKKNVSDRTKRDNNRSSHFRSPFWIFRPKDTV